ncbi:MAG: hypothetical protein M1837_000377 [Sclerophora amabilis]|nr:MAG: hypothetical protein M1837_000377 [Sclerophora amabilis]
MSGNNPGFSPYFSQTSDQRRDNHASFPSADFNSLSRPQSYHQSQGQSTSSYLHGPTNLYPDRRPQEEQNGWQSTWNGRPVEQADSWYHRQIQSGASPGHDGSNMYANSRDSATGHSEPLTNDRLYDTSALGSLAFVSGLNLAGSNRNQSAGSNSASTSRGQNVVSQTASREPMNFDAGRETFLQETALMKNGHSYGIPQQRPDSSNSNLSQPALPNTVAQSHFSARKVSSGLDSGVSFQDGGDSYPRPRSNLSGSFSMREEPGQNLEGYRQGGGTNQGRSQQAPQTSYHHNASQPITSRPESRQQSHFVSSFVTPPLLEQPQLSQMSTNYPNLPRHGSHTQRPSSGQRFRGGEGDKSAEAAPSSSAPDNTGANQIGAAKIANSNKNQFQYQLDPGKHHRTGVSHHRGNSGKFGQGPSPSPNPSATVNPNQIYNSYAYSQSEAANSANLQGKGENEMRPQSHLSAMQATVSPPAGEAAVARPPPIEPAKSSPAPGPGVNNEQATMELQMREMVEKMKEYQAKDPSLFSQVWDQLKKGPSQGNSSPQTDRLAPTTKQPNTKSTSVRADSETPLSKKHIQQGQNALNGPISGKNNGDRPLQDLSTAGSVHNPPKNGTSTTESWTSSGPPVSSTMKSHNGTNLATNTLRTQQAQPGQHASEKLRVESSSNSPQSNPIRAVTNPSRPSSKGTNWPESKVAILAATAAKALTTMPENAGKDLSAQYIRDLLKKNPSYIELCEHFEQLGFRLDRSKFAKVLLSAVPDAKSASPVSTQSIPRDPSSSSLPPQPATRPGHDQSVIKNGLSESSQLNAQSTPRRGPGRPKKHGKSNASGAKGTKDLTESSTFPLGQVWSHGDSVQPGLDNIGATNPRSMTISENDDGTRAGSLENPDHGASSQFGLSSSYFPRNNIQANHTTGSTSLDAPDPIDALVVKYLQSNEPSFTASTGTFQTQPSGQAVGELTVQGANKAAPVDTDHGPDSEPQRTYQSAAQTANGYSSIANGAVENPLLRPLPARPSATTKEEAARRRTFSDIIDLTQDIDGFQDGPMKRRRISEGTDAFDYKTTYYSLDDPSLDENVLTANHPSPGNALGTAASEDHSGLTERRKALGSIELARPIHRKSALRKSVYDSRTIARDVLIATGRHPSMRGLNAHLDSLRTNLPSIHRDSDLSTIKWSIIDPDSQSETIPSNGDNDDDVVISTFATKSSLPSPSRVAKEHLASSPYSRKTMSLGRKVGMATLGVKNATPKSASSKSKTASEGRTRKNSGRLSKEAPTGKDNSATTLDKSIKGRDSFSSAKPQIKNVGKPRDPPPPPPSNNRQDAIASGEAHTKTAEEEHDLSPQVTLPKQNSTPNGFPHSAREELVTTSINHQSSPSQESKRRPRSALFNSERPGNPSSSLSTASLTVDHGRTENRRIAQQSASGSKKTISIEDSSENSDPEFKEYKCKREGCNAKLHSLETLRKHMSKVHR